MGAPGIAHAEVAPSAGVQQMVRSDLGASGVLFTLDTESGFDQVVFITSAYGLGETVVQGAVNPDEFYVYKPNLAAGRPAILRKTRGEKAVKMVFADGERAGQSTTTVDVGEDERRHRSRTSKRTSRHLRGQHREALRPPDGHRVGRDGRRQALLCKRGPKR
jgi:pyruvate,water dikinase